MPRADITLAAVSPTHKWTYFVRSNKQIIEWLGGAAVIASLLLVAYEIRQNTDALSAQAIFELNQVAANNSQMIATDADYARLFRMGDEDPDSLNPEEWFQYQYAVWADVNMYESAYVFYEKGILSEDEYHLFLSSYCDDRALPGYQRFLSERRGAHFAGFHQTADQYCGTRD